MREKVKGKGRRVVRFASWLLFLILAFISSIPLSAYNLGFALTSQGIYSPSSSSMTISELYYRAVDLYKRKRFRAALNFLAIYLAERPNDPNANLLAAEILYELSTFSDRVESLRKAQLFLNKALELKPTCEAYYLAAKIYQDLQDIPNATESYENALSSCKPLRVDLAIDSATFFLNIIKGRF